VLTELEGAILSEVYYRGHQTAFQVRRSFADSPSLEWKGSAGAVYSAVKRLEQAGALAATATGDGRSTRLLSVTAAGRLAMLKWACDPERAVSTGIDPFRMRSGIWLQLSEKRRRRVLTDVLRELRQSIASLRAYSRKKDTIERASVDLAMRLQMVRLTWVGELLDSLSGSPPTSDGSGI
jgi:DNA-binding PadR family transcriptional regulator